MHQLWNDLVIGNPATKMGRTGLSSSWWPRRPRGMTSAYSYIRRWRNRTHNQVVNGPAVSEDCHKTADTFCADTRTYREIFFTCCRRNGRFLIVWANCKFLKAIQTINHLKEAVPHIQDEVTTWTRPDILAPAQHKKKSPTTHWFVLFSLGQEWCVEKVHLRVRMHTLKIITRQPIANTMPYTPGVWYTDIMSSLISYH